MASKDVTDEELWARLQGLGDDLLDPDMPLEQVDEELRQLGVDTFKLAAEEKAFVASLMDRQRLAWREQAAQRKAQLLASAAAPKSATTGLDRFALLERLEMLRGKSELGSVVKMAARKRRPEESTVEELRSLVEEMETLLALETAAKKER